MYGKRRCMSSEFTTTYCAEPKADSGVLSLGGVVHFSVGAIDLGDWGGGDLQSLCSQRGKKKGLRKIS